MLALCYEWPRSRVHPPCAHMPVPVRCCRAAKLILEGLTGFLIVFGPLLKVKRPVHARACLQPSHSVLCCACTVLAWHSGLACLVLAGLEH